jgi:hypothetical protein
MSFSLCVLFKYTFNCGDYVALVVHEQVTMGREWNNPERGKQKYLERNLSLYHTVHHKSHKE